METIQDTFKDSKIGRIPNDWELLSVEKCILKKKFSVGKLPKKEYSKEGRFQIIDQSKTFIVGYSNNSELLYNGNLPAIIYGDHTNHVKYVSFPFICGADGVKIIQPLDELNNKFIYYSILYRKPQSEGYKRHFSILKEKKLCIPPLPEQRKIAEILSTVDEQISTTDKIIEKSKELKKGLMQKLFSEGIGHTKFKDTKIGRIPKDWEVNLFGDFVEIKSGFGFKKDDYSDNGFRLLRIDNVTYGKIIWNNIAHIPFSFEEKYRDLVLSEGDILLSLNRPITNNQLKIGRITKNDLPSILYQRVGKLSSSSQELRDDFLYYLSKYFIYFFVQKSSVGSDQPFINLTSLRKMMVPIPSLTEQQKIAEILSEADAKIEREESQKEYLEKLKRGLMQQLLTGKKRVKV